MERILVTGADGFIGYSLVKELSKQGYVVRATYHNIYPEILNARQDGVGWVKYDLGSDIDYPSLLDGIEIVIHLAAKVHNKNKGAYDSFEKINTRGTKLLAEESAKYDIRRFIFISTIKVHGENTTKNKNEEYEYFNEEYQLNPSDSYAISKLKAENEINEICQTSDMDYVIFRPPLIYGPYVKANFLDLINVVSKGIPLPLGSVDSFRSLLYVRNLCDAIIRCFRCPRVANQKYLISDINISLQELVNRIAFHLERKAYLFPFPEKLLILGGQLTGRKNTINRLVESLLIDNSKFVNELQWKPPFSFDEGLKETVSWYMNNQK